MRMLKILIIFAMFFTPLNANAFFGIKDMSKTINKMDLERQSSVSISVKKENGRNVYKKSAAKLLNPASSLKLFTFAASLNTLGEDYEFKTSIFADNKNNLYIKLGADPLLTTDNLRALVGDAKAKCDFKKVNKIFIDDTIIDNVPYPDGWMVEDAYPNMAKISPYTLNQNKTKVNLYISTDRNRVEILQGNPYKHVFVNEIQMGAENKVNITGNCEHCGNILGLSGTISSDFQIDVYVAHPKYNFIANLNDVFEKEKIKYERGFYFEKTPANLREISSVSHTISEVSKDVIVNSNNFSAEILFKVAGAKFKSKTENGTTLDGIDMFYDFYNDIGVDIADIKIVDGSGVSRHNLLYADWMSEALVKINERFDIKKYLTQPDTGTLDSRLRHMRGKLWAKTGTLNGVSSLCGYIKTRSGKDEVFSILISNFNKQSSIIKGFEDELIDAIWEN